MKIDFEGKKWHKEISQFKKIKKEINGKFNNNEEVHIKQFKELEEKDYLRLYSRLASAYKGMARYYYLDDITNIIMLQYTYLSGLALVLVKKMYDGGIRNNYIEIIENQLDEIDYALFQLIATNQLEPQYLEIADDPLITAMYQEQYDQAKQIIDAIPDPTKEQDSQSVYYLSPMFLKYIYLAIINHDEKAFNEELAKRIKKYRRNMVGYSTIIDIVSIALIKMAKKVGIECNVDVIEIPKIFFDESCVIDKEKVKLPFYDEFLKLGII